MERMLAHVALAEGARNDRSQHHPLAQHRPTRRNSQWHLLLVLVVRSLPVAIGLLLAAACARSHLIDVRQRAGAAGRACRRRRRIPIRASASRPGCMDAGEAVVESRSSSRKTQPSAKFVGITNSDLAFTGNYAIQGNYNGYQIWDISNPEPARRSRRRTTARRRRATSRSTRTCSSCPARDSRAASTAAAQGVKDTVSKERLRGLRIFDITRHRESEERRQRADVPRLAHAHGARRSEGPGQRLHLHLRLVARPLAERAPRLRRARRPSRIRTRRSSASRSSRCRSRIRSRPRS